MTPSLYWTAFAMAISSLLLIVCCCGRMFPLNMFLLTLFTCGEAVMIGGLTSFYHSKTVVMSGLATALVTISLTIYAIRTT